VREWLRYIQTLPDWDKPNTDLDREDNNGNYEPGNLRIVPRRTNANNTRKNLEIHFGRVVYTGSEFREKFLPTWTKGNLCWHLKGGKSPEEIVAFYDKTRGIRHPVSGS
jgi:hypothetical protein